jgi:hypothetical protein
MRDPELQRWIDDPDFDHIEQDMDLILRSEFSAKELCDLLCSANLPDAKKIWVASALMEIVEHETFSETGEFQADKLCLVAAALRQNKPIATRTIPTLGMPNADLLATILAATSVDAVVAKFSSLK